MFIPLFLKPFLAQIHSTLSQKKGFIVFYLVISVAVIGVFYLIYFLFWAEIKGWYRDGH